MARLGDVFPLIRNGASIKQTNGAGGLPITRIETIANREIDRSRMGYADVTDLVKYADYQLQDGDILMSHINSEKHLGKVARYKAIDGEYIIHGMNLLMLRADKSLITPGYAECFFNSDMFLRQIPNITKKSVNQASFNVSALKELQIPIPTLATQHEIEMRFEKVDSLISLRKQQIAKLDELVKARFVEMFGNPVSNEKGWLLHDLESITTVVTYGLTVRPEYVSEGIDLVSARELHKGYIDYDAAPKISENDYGELSEKGKPQKHDILFSKTGSIGHCALVTEEKPFAITQNAARIGLKTGDVNPLWLLCYLRTDYIQEWCKGQAKGNAVKDFQLQDMKVIPVFDCPIEMQNQFAAFVAQTDQQKLTIQHSLAQLELLKKALMQKYFG